MTSTPTRPVDNVVITTKGLQDRNINILDGTTVENKGKLFLDFLLKMITLLSTTIRLVYEIQIGTFLLGIFSRVFNKRTNIAHSE